MLTCFYLHPSALFLLCPLPSAVQTVKVGDPKHLPQQRPTTYKKQVLRSLCLMTGISKCDSWTHGLPLCVLWILTGSIPGCWYRMMSLCMFCVRLVEAGCEERQSRPLPFWCVSMLVPYKLLFLSFLFFQFPVSYIQVGSAWGLTRCSVFLFLFFFF